MAVPHAAANHNGNTTRLHQETLVGARTVGPTTIPQIRQQIQLHLATPSNTTTRLHEEALVGARKVGQQVQVERGAQVVAVAHKQVGDAICLERGAAITMSSTGIQLLQQCAGRPACRRRLCLQQTVGGRSERSCIAEAGAGDVHIKVEKCLRAAAVAHKQVGDAACAAGQKPFKHRTAEHLRQNSSPTRDQSVQHSAAQQRGVDVAVAGRAPEAGGWRMGRLRHLMVV